MKAIQITIGAELLEQLDQRPEVRERGRSAVLREAAAAYIASKRAKDIANFYKKAYTKFPQTAEELVWAGQGEWPEEHPSAPAPR